MGTWSSDFFGNDDASDFLLDLEGRRVRLGKEVARLFAFDADADSIGLERCLAVSEYVAFLWGHPCAEYPTEFDDATTKASPGELSQFRQECLAFLEKLRQSSHAAEHSMREPGFMDHLDDLTRRLASEKRRRKKPDRGSAIGLLHPTDPSKSTTFRLGVGADKLLGLVDEGQVDFIRLGFNHDEYSTDEIHLIRDVIVRRPDVGVSIRNDSIVNQLKLLGSEQLNALKSLLGACRRLELLIELSEREIATIYQLMESKDSSIRIITITNGHREGVFDLTALAHLPALEKVTFVRHPGRILNASVLSARGCVVEVPREPL